MGYSVNRELHLLQRKFVLQWRDGCSAVHAVVSLGFYADCELKLTNFVHGNLLWRIFPEVKLEANSLLHDLRMMGEADCVLISRG